MFYCLVNNKNHIVFDTASMDNAIVWIIQQNYNLQAMVITERQPGATSYECKYIIIKVVFQRI